MNKRYLIALVVLMPGFLLFGQKVALYGSYGQSTFLYKPGVDVAVAVYKNYGVQLGLEGYIQDADPKQLANQTDDYRYSYYGASLDVFATLRINELHFIRPLLGYKVYYGPYYLPLHVYTEGGYTIYYDASAMMPDFGVDIGLAYFYKRFTGMVKYDLALTQFRVGLGYAFRIK